jgi:uncharacterized protein YecE (DUF72 family)
MLPSGKTSGMTATTASVPGLYVGTSGWSYPTWRGGFYPEKARPAEFLRFYSERFSSVELNTSFYQLPEEEQFRAWAEQTPPDFRFAVKMTGRITHSGQLGLVGTFCERVRLLGERLGPVLVQLPETRPRDDGFLALLLGSLDPELEVAFEFRHESWAGVEVPVLVTRPSATCACGNRRMTRPPSPPGPTGYGRCSTTAFASTATSSTRTSRPGLRTRSA